MAPNGTRDRALIACLAAGLTYAEAADVAHVSARTVKRRMADPDFSAAVHDARTEHVDRLAARLGALATLAIDALEDTIRTGPPGLRLRAAQVLLSEWRQTRDAALERRLDALETAANLEPAVSVRVAA